MTGDYNSEASFSPKVLLTDTKVLRLCEAFANGLSTNTELSKTQLSKIVQLGGFLGRLLGPLLKTCLPLMKSLL